MKKVVIFCSGQARNMASMWLNDAEVSSLFPSRPLSLFDTFDGFPEQNMAYETRHYGGKVRTGVFCVLRKGYPSA